MVHRNTAVMRLCAFGIVLIASCSSFNTEKSLARVLLSQDRSVEDGYNVEIESNGETRQFKLTPMENIWSDNAKALIFSRNENGEQITERMNINDNIKVYHDSDTGSVFSLEDGQINGIFDTEHMIQSDEEGNHYVRKLNKNTFDQFDAVEVPEKFREMVIEPLPMQTNNTKIPIPMMNRDNFRQTAPIYYTAEIAVIIDSVLANLIGNNANVFTYVTIFYNAVNKRFQTISNPKIIIRISACVIMRTSTDEPFITNNLVGTKVNGINALYAEASYIYSKLSTLPDHDMFYLQTGRDMIDGNNTGLAGLAFVAAVCFKNGNGYSYATGMGEDIGAFFDGVLTAAHEIAHNLGAPHDNDTASGTSACPSSDGYIMSYKFGVPNHNFFSTCSISKMASYLINAGCVKINITTTSPPGVFTSTNLPGDVITMNTQCKSISGRTNATVYKEVNPEDGHCYNLKCLFYENGTNWVMTTYRSAAEGSVCPSGVKRCRNGVCVAP